MDRNKGAAGSLNLGFAVTRVLFISLVVGLIGLLTILPGCSSQGSAARRTLQQIRPANNTALLVQNAAYLKKTGRVELAVKDLEDAHLQEPENLEVLDALIQSYEELGDFDRSQELYEEALSRGGHHPALENNRCYSLYLQGRFGQAEACFRKVLAQQPDNQAARNNLGLVLCQQGREAEALTMWREALSDGEARQRLGQALSALSKEVPPNLAGPTTSPAKQQVAASANTEASSVSAGAKKAEPITPQAAPTPTLPEQPLVKTATPAPRPSSPSPTTAVLTTTAFPAQTEHPLAPAKAPAEQQVAASANTEASSVSAGAKKAEPITPQAAPTPTIPEQPLAKTDTPTPRPSSPSPTTAVQTATDFRAEKEPTPAPTKAPLMAEVKKTKTAPPQLLSVLDLTGTWIEVKNGNGVQDQARKTRNQLSLEGFTVVGIGNHTNFGLEETVITYRPESDRVAETLASKFFPGAKLQKGGNLSREVDIQISLGRDRLADKNIARTHEVPLGSVPSSSPDSAATLSLGKGAGEKPPRQTSPL